MKRLVPATIAAVLTVGTFLGLVYAAGSFNQKLSPNQQIIHALNRLTFGPHPGDVEEVRRIGLAKWIELQLHPDRIQENPVLEGKLKPLATLNMSMADVVREYTPRPQEPIAMTTPFGPLNKGLSRVPAVAFTAPATELKCNRETVDVLLVGPFNQCVPPIPRD